MKKTIIAAAIATVIAAPAMADVSVSGVVEQTFTDTDSVTDTGLASGTDSGLTFKASEDLGNGLTAFAQISLDTDNQDEEEREGNSEKDSKVGIKGGFGTVVVGRMEDFTEGVMAATMTLNGTGAIELGGNASRNNGAVAYVSPTVNGFHAGVAGYTAAITGEDDNFDATDIIVAYSNGPLTVMASQESMSAATAAAIGTGIAEETTSFAVKYGMGDLSAAALFVNRDAGATDSDDVMLRVDYKMGNNKITLAHADDESADNKIVGLELTHSMSKRTSAYVGMTDADAANTDTTYFGMIHKF
ncbi:MAG: porin [Gammaproteobacteria bacterium]|nr:porin [Gammaproteobacteria bacterium]